VNVVCARSALAETLGAVSRAASGRGVVQVLSGVRLEALGDRLVLSATDTEISLRAAVPADVEVEGVAVVPARTLLDLLRKLPMEQVTLELETSSALRVVSGEADYRLNTLPAADFPALPSAPPGERARVERAGFVRAFESVARAAARDASRPVYTGVLVTLAAGDLTMVATDGHRLAVRRARLEAVGDVASTLIPARALVELTRLPVDDEWLELSVTDNLVSFEVGGYRLTARRLNGQFQPFEPLLASAFAHEALVGRELLLEAVDRATVVVQRNSPVVLAFGADGVSLRVTTAEVGEATERMPLRKPGPDITVAFNPRYLLDGLQLIEGDDVTFKLNDELRPVVLQGATDSFTYLVAPVRRAGARS
jgi:DNA polymerase-3 subunit beta